MKLPSTTSLAVGLDRIAGRAAAATHAIDQADRLARQITTTAATGELAALAIQIRAELAEARAALAICQRG
jgi:hypothetical protein